jgi:uncharacterized membrane protein YfcA
MFDSGLFASPLVLAFTVFAFVLAGFVKGVIGMGLPTVLVGLLSLVMSPAQAAALLVIPSLITNIWQFVFGPHRMATVRRLWPMMVAICAGTWLATLAGFGLLTAEAAGRAKNALGVSLIAYALIGFTNVRFAVPRHAEAWLGPLVGAVTGMILAVTGVFVIPAVPYLQAMKLDRDELVQALGLNFLVATVALAGSLAGNGVITTEIGSASLFAVAPALLGMAGGQWLRLRIRADVFRLCFFLGMLLLGAHLALLH